MTFAGAETKTPARFAPAGVLKSVWCFFYLLRALDGARGTTTLTSRTTGTTRIEMTRATEAIAAAMNGTEAIRSSEGICRQGRKTVEQRLETSPEKNTTLFFIGTKPLSIKRPWSAPMGIQRAPIGARRTCAVLRPCQKPKPVQRSRPRLPPGRAVWRTASFRPKKKRWP